MATPLLMLLVGWLARALGAPAYLLLLGPLMTACALLLLPSEIMLCVIGVAAMVAVAIGGGENTLAVGAGAVAVGVWVIPLYLLLARLRAERDNFALIRSLVSEIPGSLDPSSVLDAIVHTATDSLGAKAASIRLLTEDERTLEIKATYGLSERYLAKGDVLLEESELDRRVLMGQVVCVRDAGHDDSLQYPEEAASEGIASVLCVPLCVRGRCGGVLRVYTEQPRDFTEAQASLLRTFAAVAAVALEQAHAHQGAVRYMRKAAHELRSPMCTVQTIVRGAAQGVTGDVDEQTRELLVRAANRVDGLLAVLDDLLSLSRMRMTPPSECEPVDLRDAVQAAVELHEPQAQEKGIDFRADVPSEPVLVRATVQHLEDLARNLISNAVKYTDEGGSVAITLTGTGGRARLTVADTGIGMSEEDVAELGAEFWRSKSARRSGAPGTGLGISIVKGLLERYGGRLDVDSEEGRGTTMTIELPGT
ncbi:MAG: GAF domain-containing protein [Armatimonadia bacterium]|nr:GAF domain-containing protein [Armatimonadia bacterium]